MQENPYSLQSQIEHLNRIGISLTLEHDLQTLLELIVAEARSLCNAEGGSLYLVHRGKLRFTVAQNEALRNRPGGEQTVRDSFGRIDLEIASDSIAGHVAASARPLNIDDVYQIPESDGYCFSPFFDQMNNYRTQSMILVPMMNRDGAVEGVLCLVNARDAVGSIVSFHPEYERLLESVSSQAMAAIENARLIEKLKSSYLDTILCLSIAAEQRDNETGAHVRRLSEYSGIVAERLGFPGQEEEILRYASPLHDVGKIGIPDTILRKPGKLTEEEYEQMKTHTTIGERILQGDSEYIQAGKTVALTHHERVDGAGYPRGLKGEKIPIFGRIVTVVDAFDAIISPRVYKGPRDPEQARQLMQEENGAQFCPEVMNAFDKAFPDMLAAREMFPNPEEGAEDRT